MTKCINKHEFVPRYWSLLVSHTLSLHLLTASPAQLSALSTWTTLKSLSTESLRSSVTASQLGRLSLMNRFLHPGKLSGAHFLWFRFQLTVAPFNEFLLLLFFLDSFRPGSCAGEGSAAAYKSSTTFPDETLTFIKSYPLMDESVPSINDRPYFTRTTSR